MITVWGRRNSVNVQKVLWALEELDVPYRARMSAAVSAATTTRTSCAMNPMGLVPVIRDGDVTMFEFERHRALARGALSRRRAAPRRSPRPRHGGTVDGMGAAEFRAAVGTLFVNLVRSLAENRNIGNRRSRGAGGGSHPGG